MRDAPTQAALHDADEALGSFSHLPAAPLTGGAGPLTGLTAQVKANIAVAGLPLTASSAMLDGFIAPRDATVVARLKAAGATIVGLGNMDEFGMGSSTERSLTGATRNPWDLQRTAGGSSGGGAAAVAAGLVDVALGTDTGGSVRQPAAFCGVVGFKPGYGRLSRQGVVAYASSLDQVGVLARDVATVAKVYAALAGVDDGDGTTVDNPVGMDGWQAPGTMADAWQGRRVGVPRSLIDGKGRPGGAGGVDEEVRSAFEDRLQALREAGAEVVDVEVPGLEASVSAYYVIATAEASSNLSRYDGVRFGPRGASGEGIGGLISSSRRAFGPEVRRRILLGSFVLSHGFYDAYLKKAQLVRRRLADGFAAVLADVDAVAMPTTPTVAFGLGEKLSDPLAMYLADVFTVAANLAGLPAVSVPAGPGASSSMPVGFQLIGRAWDEAGLLTLAAPLVVPLSCPRQPLSTRP